MFLTVIALAHVVSAENWIGDSGDLIFASVLYRHGDRNPVTTYPTDPYASPSFWDTDWGQLTNVSLSKGYTQEIPFRKHRFLDWQARAIHVGPMVEEEIQFDIEQRIFKE